MTTTMVLPDNRMRKWHNESGLPGLCRHGTDGGQRKVMVEMGCSVHDVMFVQGHSGSKTSDVYTKTINHHHQAKNAMEKWPVWIGKITKVYCAHFCSTFFHLNN